ncbi:DNA recombination protein RmuC [Candidatus Uhrbacteria bacterium]|nr:DNA recombination protein RmuC [Candidatus Uhrbacteria bacterium]
MPTFWHFLYRWIQNIVFLSGFQGSYPQFLIFMVYYDTMSTTLLAILALVILILLGLVVYLLKRGSGKGEGVMLLEQRLDNLNRTLLDQLNTVTRQVNDRLKENMEAIYGSNKTVGERLDNASKVVGLLQHKLGELGEATKQVFSVGKDISSLQEILRAPKLRGGLGELFLGDLLAQILPPAHYKLQYRFKSGEAVDAVVKLRDDKLVPVDSKFPLENFKKMLETEGEDEKTRFRKQFINDVKKHIDKIAKLYILPDESTFDFALMYIPAENVYYETILKGDDEHSLMHYAYDRRVIPVSPNSFYVYLQAILMGLRGMQVERSAADILKNLARLSGDLNKFKSDFELVGTHLTRAKNSYDDSVKRLDRFQDKLVTAAPGQLEGENGNLPLPPVNA